MRNQLLVLFFALGMGMNSAFCADSETTQGAGVPVSDAPVNPSPAAPAAAASIRQIDFHNFRYPSGCSKDDPGYPAIILVAGGKWEKGKVDDEGYKDYEISAPQYTRLLGTNDEQAVIVASCFLGNWSATEVFVYGMGHGKPVLIQRLADSDWAPEGCWMETVKPEVKNNRLVVSFLSGGIHAQPAWRVTATMKWNGSKFVRTEAVKKPYKP
jgi:hypothetical protein